MQNCLHKIANELYHNGLDLRAIQKTSNNLINILPTQCLLREEAYKPTGIALGCPLPESKQFELFALSHLVDARLREYSSSEQPSFAYVPADSYHITIANRTHYESSVVSYLNGEELEAVKALIHKLHLQTIRVIAAGLILTYSGHLLVKCLPIDDKILQLRTQLAHNFRWLRTNMPTMAHIKLGHLMVPLVNSQLQSFNAWLAMIEQHAIFDLVFTDVYTPQGRISL